MTARSPQKSIVLILARELASKLATAVFLVDPEGTLIYFNEPAEAILGRTFAEAGELTAEEWSSDFDPEDLSGGSLAATELPLGVALGKQEPAHLRFRITGFDGVKREISVTAFPLFASEEEMVGATAIFWEEEPGIAPA